MRYKINVTKTDIKKGWCADATRCAVARALSRDLKGMASDISVLGETFSYTDTAGYWVSCYLPKKVNQFIIKFDDLYPIRETFKPFSFTIIL